MAKITVSKTQLPEPKRGRDAKPNPYLESVGSFIDGKTRTLKLDPDEKAQTELSKLRAAAKTLTPPKGVRAVIAQDERSFDFRLIDFTPRPRKAKDESPAA